MAAPLLVFSITRAVEPVPGLRLYEVCVENPDLDVVKAAYSVGSALVQYLAPIAIVSVAHAQIRNKLRTRMGAAAAQPRPTRAASAGEPSLTETQTAAVRVVVESSPATTPDRQGLQLTHRNLVQPKTTQPG